MLRISRPSQELTRALLVSQVLAVIYWLFTYLESAATNVPPWFDQQTVFLQLPGQWTTPYSVLRFANPPWTVIPLLPFQLIPFYPSTLIQACLSFALLTLVIFKFGGGLRAAILTFTSFLALDSIIELNVEWLIYLGLLVPPALSGFFLVIRPQDALGYWFTFKRKTLARAIIIFLAIFLVSLLVWGFWPLQMLEAMQRLGSYGQYRFNVAPASFLSYPISAAIGLWFALRAIRQRDPVFAILSWLFFVPYLAFYALLLHFAAVSVRFPRFALLTSTLVWIIFGGTVLIAAVIWLKSH